MRLQYTVQLQIKHVVLNENQAWPPALKCEAAQYIDFVAFHINRKQVDRDRSFGLHKDVIKSAYRHFDDLFLAHAGDKEIQVERGLNAGKLERQCLAGILR